jgi:hypothetical protein
MIISFIKSNKAFIKGAAIVLSIVCLLFLALFLKEILTQNEEYEKALDISEKIRAEREILYLEKDNEIAQYVGIIDSINTYQSLVIESLDSLNKEQNEIIKNLSDISYDNVSDIDRNFRDSEISKLTAKLAVKRQRVSGLLQQDDIDSLGVEQ